MTYYSVSKPYELFFDNNGDPLEDGYIYIGEVNQNPITNPINVYWDAAGLYPAAQPIRTIAGYPSRNGSPGNLFINASDNQNFSILVQDKNQNFIYSNADAIARYISTNTVDTISDLRSLQNFDIPIWVRGHSSVGDGGAGFFEWFDGAAPGTYVDDNGTVIVPTGGDGSAARLRQYSGARNVNWYGIFGDYDIGASTGTDNAASLQALFDLIYRSTTKGFIQYKEGLISGVFDIFFPNGVYYTSTGLEIGASGEYIGGIKVFCNNGAMLYSDAAGFVLTLTNIAQCEFRLHIVNSVGNGLKIDTADNCTFDVSAGAVGTYCLYTVGFIYNNQWPRMLLGQSAWQNNATYGWYADYTFTTEDTFAGMPLNNIDLLTISGMDTGIYWIDSSGVTGNAGAITIAVLDHETNPSITDSCYFEGIQRPIVIRSVWSESAADNLFNFVDCSNVSIEGMHCGGASSPGTRVIRAEDCGILSLKNIEAFAGLNIVGTLNQLSIDNCEFWSNSSRIIFTNRTQTQTYDNILNLNCRNIRVRDTATTTLKGYFTQIINGSFDTTNNLILNPKAVYALGDMDDLFCAATQNGAYTDISPLGYRETLVTIDGLGAHARLQLDIDTTKLNEETLMCTLIVCWKVHPVTGGADIIHSGNMFDAKWVNYYGDIHLYLTDGSANDWIITATILELDDARTYVEIPWNYATIYNIGDQWLFGGAVLYGGHEIRLPQL